MSDRPVIFNPNEGKPPEFPPYQGSEDYSKRDRTRIAEAAWAKANGNMTAYEQLIGEHMRGEIDLLGSRSGFDADMQAQVDAAAAAGGGPTRQVMAPGVDAPQVELGNEHGVAAGPAADAAEAERKAAEATAAANQPAEPASGRRGR